MKLLLIKIKLINNRKLKKKNMKKLVFKALSIVISLHYILLAKALIAESFDEARIRTKLDSIARSLKFLTGGGRNTSVNKVNYVDHGIWMRWWLRLEAILLFFSVYQLLCGRRIGPRVMVTISVIGVIFENNPFADFTFELDKTEAKRQAWSELAMIGAMLVFIASSSFKYARVIVWKVGAAK